MSATPAPPACPPSHTDSINCNSHHHSGCCDATSWIQNQNCKNISEKNKFCVSPRYWLLLLLGCDTFALKPVQTPDPCAGDSPNPCAGDSPDTCPMCRWQSRRLTHVRVTVQTPGPCQDEVMIKMLPLQCLEYTHFHPGCSVIRAINPFYAFKSVIRLSSCLLLSAGQTWLFSCSSCEYTTLAYINLKDHPQTIHAALSSIVTIVTETVYRIVPDPPDKPCYEQYLKCTLPSSKGSLKKKHGK